MTEQQIVDDLCEEFVFLEYRIGVQRKQRIFTKPLDRNEFELVIHYAHDRIGFTKTLHVVGVDDGDHLGFVYLLSNEDNIILALKEKAPKSDPRITSMSELYPSLILHERELVDLFGAKVEGLPDGPSYPLPDGWPTGNYPMRKEWKTEYFDKETMTYNPPAGDENKE